MKGIPAFNSFAFFFLTFVSFSFKLPLSPLFFPPSDIYFWSISPALVSFMNVVPNFLTFPEGHALEWSSMHKTTKLPLSRHHHNS